VICRVGERVRVGRAIDCPAAVDPGRLAEAVRADAAVDGEPTLSVTCRPPSPVHDHVGCLRPGMGLRTRTALARAGRARGWTTALDDRIAALREELDAIEVASVETRTDRRRVAEAGADTAALRERVAEARGRLQARRDENGNGAADTAGDALADAVAELADAETGAVAARQTLARERANARAVRERLGERRRLADELASLRRRARARLVDRLAAEYRSALRAVPGEVGSDRGEDVTDPVDADPFDADPVPAALAVARVARLDAPVVLACDRFPDADAAAEWLAAPVLRLRV
jgi:hypothetical protein